MREINDLSIHQRLRSAIRDSQQPTSPIGFLFLKFPPPPCAVLLVIWMEHEECLADGFETRYPDIGEFSPFSTLPGVAPLQ